MDIRVSPKRKIRKHVKLSSLFACRRVRNEILKELEKKYPEQKFRISKQRKIQRLYNISWLTVCKHNTQLSLCKHSTCGGGKGLCKHFRIRSACKECGGSVYCKHNKIKRRCKEIECGGGKDYCPHNRLKTFCVECKGGSMCKHGKTRTFCADPECKGGKGLCSHGISRSICKVKECKGGGSYCSHGIKRGDCRNPECKGGGNYCSCKIHKSYCTMHGGSKLCILCKVKVKKIGMYCRACHPEYVPAMKNASKISCEYICILQTYLGLIIQHTHYDKISKLVIGVEYRLPEYKTKPVDGFYIDTEGQKIVIEFLGDIFHGHPSLWGEDEKNTNRYGEVHKDNFYNTERIFIKVASFGYIIRYVWECDYKKLKALQSPQSILREFKGKLEY